MPAHCLCTCTLLPQIFTTLFTISALGFAVGRFSINAGDFLTALRTIAGEGGGDLVLRGVRQAVNTIKVINMLNELRDVLRVSGKRIQNEI